MTVQANDSFIYKHKKYILIDVEKGKQIINCAQFQMPRMISSFSSACCRGYTAKYKVVDNRLYCIKCKWDSSQKKDIESTNKFMNYTGSCIVARMESEDNWELADSLSDYLDYDSALEIHFTNGVVDEVNDLEKGIEEAKTYHKDYDRLNKVILLQHHDKDKEFIARKYLKYQYEDIRSYKWRNVGTGEKATSGDYRIEI